MGKPLVRFREGQETNRIWKRYCGTIAKAGGNGENKHLPAVAEGSCLLKQKNGLSRRKAKTRKMIDIGRPSQAFPVTPPGIRVAYHGGSIELSITRYGHSRKTD